MVTLNRGETQVVQWKILALLAMFYDAMEAVYQLVENAGDAGATDIWVVLGKETIKIIDNGTGMALMPPEELEKLRQLSQEDEPFTEFEDIREAFSKVALHSLQWYAECIALSAKAMPEIAERGDIRGTKGVGKESWRSIGNECTVLTRPAYSLAKRYPGWEGLLPTEVPTLLFKHAGQEQLENRSTEYQIGISSELLRDPHGKELEHGTAVKITDLRKGDIWELRRPRTVVKRLQSRFGRDIKAGRYQITVVDRVTHQGRSQKTRTGIFRIVPPPKYEGTLILEKRFCIEHEGEKHFCTAELYYDPEGQGLSPRVLYRNREASPLSELGEQQFQTYPWHGKVTGAISYISLGAGDEYLWDAAKEKPAKIAVYREWVAGVKRLTPHLEQAMEKVDKEAKQEELQELGRDLTSVMNDLLRELEDHPIRDVVGVPPPERKKKRGKARKSPFEEYVIVRVRNQDDRGVPNVTITLYRGTEALQQEKTGVYGRKTFGIWPPGTYRLEIEVDPNKARVLGSPVRKFKLAKDNPGTEAVFTVETLIPLPPIQRPRRPKVRFQFRGLADPDVPWRDAIATRGTVEINTLAEAMKIARDAGNWTEVTRLIAHYAAAAISHASFPKDAHTALLQSSLLFPVILARLREKRKG